jgi:hypothetical protein
VPFLSLDKVVVMSEDGPAQLEHVTINFEYGDSPYPVCRKQPVELYQQFTAPTAAGHGFLEENVSVLKIPDDIEHDWWGSPSSYWMRQKVRRAVKLGYEFGPFVFNDHLDDVFEINTSLAERQGRPMSASYTERPHPISPLGEQLCPRHGYRHYGVLRDGRLYAYSFVRQCGEMMLFSRILGHGDFMADGIMQLLVFEAVKDLQEHSGTRWAVYHLHDSGTEGLQFFKRKMGFGPYRVRWQLAAEGVPVPEEPLTRP